MQISNLWLKLRFETKFESLKIVLEEVLWNGDPNRSAAIDSMIQIYHPEMVET